MSKKERINHTILLCSLLLLVTFYAWHRLGAQVGERRAVVTERKVQLLDLEEKKLELTKLKQEVATLKSEKASFANAIPSQESDTGFLETMLKLLQSLKGDVESLTPGEVEVSAYGEPFKAMHFVLRCTSTQKEVDLFIEKLCKEPYVQLVQMEQYEKGDGKVYVVLSLKVYSRTGV